MQLKDLKKGQKFKLYYGDEIVTAKVINNDTENCKIYFSIMEFFGLLPIGIEAVRDYHTSNFKDFSTLNP